MKVRSVIFAFLFLFPVIAFAQDSIHFRDIRLDEALQDARAEKKPVFFMGYATWCEHCKRMKEVIFKDAVVADYYNKHFICVKQDMEKGDGIILHNKFRIRSYPGLIFLDADGTTLYGSSGEKNYSMMIDLGKTALTPTMQYPYLKAQFEKDVTNSEKCYAYVFALRTAMLDCEEPAKKHLATQTDAQLLNGLNWKIIANGVRDINSREFQFVLSHQKQYESIASPLRVERKFVNIADELLSPFVNGKDSAGYFTRRPEAESMHYPKVDSLLFKYDLNIYQSIGNWNEYRKVADKSAESLAWYNGSLLKEIGNNYIAHVTDTASLTKAAKWMKRAIELSDEYTPYMLCAKLYQNAGDKKSAVEMAEKAKSFALKFGFSHFDADALLNELQK